MLWDKKKQKEKQNKQCDTIYLQKGLSLYYGYVILMIVISDGGFRGRRRTWFAVNDSRWPPGRINLVKQNFFFSRIEGQVFVLSPSKIISHMSIQGFVICIDLV